jgi:hypothetical protein
VATFSHVLLVDAKSIYPEVNLMVILIVGFRDISELKFIFVLRE